MKAFRGKRHVRARKSIIEGRFNKQIRRIDRWLRALKVFVKSSRSFYANNQ